MVVFTVFELRFFLIYPAMLNKYFKLKESGTSVRTEVIAGVTTFATMAYIVFVQPAVLGSAGMDVGAVFVSTCLVTAFTTALMAFLANYPVAVAPAMGHNFFFAYIVVLIARRVQGAMLFGILISAVAGVALGVVKSPHWILI